MNPIISVIVPVYNEEKYIDRCMESLKKQTYRNLQIIMVDGGSTDTSGDKCDKWAQCWNKGRNSNRGIAEVVHTGNRGVSVSRNLGLSHAIGSYIFFLDGDDWLAPCAIETLYKLILENEADIAGCDFANCYIEPGETPDNGLDAQTDYNLDNGTETISSREFIDSHLLKGDVHCWGRLYKKEIISSIRFREGLTIGEDMLFLLETILKCSRVSHTKQKLYNYYRNPKGVMSRSFTQPAMDQIKSWECVRDKLTAFCPEYASDPTLKSHILISSMLTAGRIALLDTGNRRDPVIKEDTAEIKKAIKNNLSGKSFSKLDWGYRLKVILFAISPNCYYRLYHCHKR